MRPLRWEIPWHCIVRRRFSSLMAHASCWLRCSRLIFYCFITDSPLLSTSPNRAHKNIWHVLDEAINSSGQDFLFCLFKEIFTPRLTLFSTDPPGQGCHPFQLHGFRLMFLLFVYLSSRWVFHLKLIYDPGNKAIKISNWTMFTLTRWNHNNTFGLVLVKKYKPNTLEIGFGRGHHKTEVYVHGNSHFLLVLTFFLSFSGEGTKVNRNQKLIDLWLWLTLRAREGEENFLETIRKGDSSAHNSFCQKISNT